MARKKATEAEVQATLDAITPADEWGAKEEIALFAMLTPALALAYTERFWARVCLSFSEQAAVAAERMRFRAMDEHTTRFYAWDGPIGRGADDVHRECLAAAERYRRISLWLIACVHEGHEWVTAETARMNEARP